MSRWDATLNWGPDEGHRDDDDEQVAAAIAAAIHELAEQRTAWLELARALPWLSPPTALRPVPAER
jgi:hypothetical protein